MIQVFAVVQPYLSYGGDTTYWPLLAGGQGAGLGLTVNDHRVPMAFASTVRNLVVYANDPLRLEAVTVTVLKNGVDTGLLVTLDVADVVATITGVDVAYSVLDDISFKAVTDTSHVAFGFTIGVCVEIESEGNVYGLPMAGGTSRIGGAFGNGIAAVWGGPGNGSASYSITATPGNVTTLVLRTYSGAVAPGTVITGWIMLEGVVQDGAPGTVDTTCTIATGNTTGISTFTLPTVIGDHVEIVWTRSGAAHQIAAGVGFEPTNAGYFMLSGGSNNTIPVPTAYVWNTVDQLNTVEAIAVAPVSASGLVARGLYVERNVVPGTGEEVAHILRRNEGSTAISVTLADAEFQGVIADQYVEYNDGDHITLYVLSSAGAPGGSQFHWGLEASLVGVGPDAVGVIGPLLWVEWPRLVVEGS